MSKPQPLVSLIVPVYRAGSSLECCVNSILSQTEVNIELILVDDGSTKADLDYCKKISVENENIKLIERENGGVSAARNSGIEIARGDYLGFVDSDDEIKTDMVRTLLDAIEKSGEKIAVCGVTVNNADGMGGYIFDGKITVAEYLNHISRPDGWEYIISCNKLYSRELFDFARFPDGKIHEDEFLIPQLVVRAGGAVCVSKKCYVYNLHKGNISQTMSAARFDYIEALTEQLKLVKNEHLDSLCEGIIKREMYAYLVLYSSALMKDKSNYKRLTELHGEFLKMAEECRISLPLKIKKLLIKSTPHMYYKIDSAILRLRK